MAKNKAEFSLNVNSTNSSAIIFDVCKCFDNLYKESDSSPIDTFYEKGIELNKLIPFDNYTAMLGNLVILGYISAVESYFRELLRRLILIDTIAQKACEAEKVSYGAATYNEYSLLPEALFDGISLAGDSNIIKSLNKYLGFNFAENGLPSDLKEVQLQFSKICELRHCIIHRFGKLGSKNALSLGIIKSNKELLEKPMKISYGSLQEAISICQNIVKLWNNFVFRQVMLRLINHGSDNWKWDLRNPSDMKKFEMYYKIFYSNKYAPSPIITAKELYAEYRKYYFSIQKKK